MLLLVIAAYFAVLLLISRLTAGRGDNDAFYRGSRVSPWWAVCFGMLGASVSGVSFVSVPGMVAANGMTYLQMCMGFVLGYALVAFVLLPVYYRLGLITIYTYLRQRFGMVSYRTGAAAFFFSKLAGAAIRLFLACMILQRLVFDAMGVPFVMTVSVVVLLIWIYTRQSGIRTIVWSDCLQTTFMLAALGLIVWQVCTKLHPAEGSVLDALVSNPMSRVFDFDDLSRPSNFFKQFVSGIFTVVVMTGLDQDMMQKNLTCRTLAESQKNMCVNGLLYLPMNLLLLSLGVLLYMFCEQQGLTVPASGDELLPMLCGGGHLGQTAMILFAVGITAAAFSSADSALASLTTCFCVDMMLRPEDERLRRLAHPAIAAVMVLFILLVSMAGQSSIISVVYMVCGYTYGPLLGLFAFGLTTRRMPRETFVPFVCLLSPILCYALSVTTERMWDYHIGFEMLLINGAFTFLGLLLCSRKGR